MSAEYLGMDGGVHHKFDKLIFKRHEVPSSESSSSKGMKVESVMQNVLVRSNDKI